MSDQLCDRENLVKKLFNTSDMAQIRRILIEESIAKMVEPTMTDGERIAKEHVIKHPADGLEIFGMMCRTMSYGISDHHVKAISARMKNAIEAALAARTEAAAKIVENPCWLTADAAKVIASAIRKLGEAK